MVVIWDTTPGVAAALSCTWMVEDIANVLEFP